MKETQCLRALSVGNGENKSPTAEPASATKDGTANRRDVRNRFGYNFCQFCARQHTTTRLNRGYCSEHCRFWDQVDRSAGPTACWPWLGFVRQDGYGRFFACAPRSGEGTISVGAHRRAYVLATGADPGELFVCHSCDNRRCCNPRHLWLGTTDDNMRDMSLKGRQYRKMAPETARAILNAPGRGVDIARVFGVRPETVYRIKKRTHWKHL
jgi:hypothetical protein